MGGGGKIAGGGHVNIEIQQSYRYSRWARGYIIKHYKVAMLTLFSLFKLKCVALIQLV